MCEVLLLLACRKEEELRLLVPVGTIATCLFCCRCRMTGEQIPQLLLLPLTGAVQTIGTKPCFVCLQMHCIMEIAIN